MTKSIMFTSNPVSSSSAAMSRTCAGAGGVLSMISSVINDAKVMETEAIQAENDSQGAYEAFVKDTNDQIAADMKETDRKSVV